MSLQTIEQTALRIYEINRKQANLEDEKQLLKKSLGFAMKEAKEDQVVFRLDEVSDLKVTVAPRTTTKLDKEELAADLDISKEAAGKKDVLIKKVEEGRLTHSQFKSYEYDETVDQVSVRRVNA